MALLLKERLHRGITSSSLSRCGCEKVLAGWIQPGCKMSEVYEEDFSLSASDIPPPVVTYCFMTQMGKHLTPTFRSLDPTRD